MKKIFALLMMFLISGNFVFAQGSIASVQPKLNFQAVVRDADNHLLFNDEMSVQININYGTEVYSETHANVMTNQNGMLNIVIGSDDVTDVTGSLDDVIWAGATIEAVITYVTDPVTVTDADGNVTTSAGEEATITITTPVTAVPYALQSGPSKLTTDMIVEYVSNAHYGDEVDPNDALAILDALVHNPYGLKNALKDTIIRYLKNHKDIAKDIFKSYLEQTTEDDVQDAYDYITANTAAMERIRYLCKEFIKSHKAEAAGIVEYYAEHATVAEMNRIYNAMKANPDVMATVKKFVRQHLQEYLVEHHYVSIDGCTGVEICALANQGKSCPPASFLGATSIVDNKLQTVINNPEDLSLEITYEFSYVLDSEVIYDTYAGVKDGANLIKSVGEIPAEATNVQGTITIHAYGCEASYDRTATFNF